jgi:N-acetylmuramic acid 6-phosphate etherase
MDEFIKITESASRYRHLEKMSISELLTHINYEDQTVPVAVQKQIPSIENLVLTIVDKLLLGGRLFYIGAGTSGRLGVLDASECPPTFGVPEGFVNGIIAGGLPALTHAVENAEDNETQGWLDLQNENINTKDIVIGIAASGTTPYVIGALQKCIENHITTGSICCNPHAPLSKVSDFPIEVIVGPEFVTGSTRMKSGTAQKLILNMISTSVMIQLGRVDDNKMINLQLTNEKLLDRGVKMLMDKLQLADYEDAKNKLLSAGSVKLAIQANI